MARLSNKLYLTPSQKAEVEKIKRASSRLNRAAQKDPAQAEKFFREIGYFDMMPGSLEQFRKNVANQAKTSNTTNKRKRAKS